MWFLQKIVEAGCDFDWVSATPSHPHPHPLVHTHPLLMIQPPFFFASSHTHWACVCVCVCVVGPGLTPYSNPSHTSGTLPREGSRSFLSSSITLR